MLPFWKERSDKTLEQERETNQVAKTAGDGDERKDGDEMLGHVG